MIEVKVKSEKRKQFSLSIKDKEIGKLFFKNWWSVINAVVMLSDGNVFQIRSKSIWRTQVEVTQDEKLLVAYRANWKGHILVTALFKRTPTEFVFKRKGIFKGIYVLLDNSNQELLAVEPLFKWSRFRYEYMIKAQQNIFRDAEMENTLFYFIAAHCTNLTIARNAAHGGY